jgi:plasmid stabilization system protein ParE
VVIWSLHARKQVSEIHDYIARESKFYAKHVATAIANRVVGLDELPRKGRIVPELNEETVRELSQYSWRIIYEIRGEGLPASIEILAVIHKRRDLQQDEIPRNA